MAKIEVYEVLGLVCNEGAEVSSNDTMPCWAFALVELGGVSWGCRRAIGRHTVFLICIAMS